MIAGRSPWLCHGTTPPGSTTSLRRRNWRPWIFAGSFARSIDESTVSVTPFAGVLSAFVTLTPILSAGHSPALAAPAARVRPPSTTAAMERLRQSAGARVVLLIIADVSLPLLWRRSDWP